MTNSIQITATQRIALVGKTGSGKTFLAERLIAPIQRLVVFDPKGTLKGKWGLTEWTLEIETALRDGSYVRVRVPYPLNGDWAYYLWKIYYAGDVTTYIDESYGLVNGKGRGEAIEALTALYTRGRELQLGMIAATQRPTWIPLFMLSECEWYSVFRLNWPDDRKRMATMIGKEAQTIPPDNHGFWLYNADWDKPVYIKSVQDTPVEPVVIEEPPYLFRLKVKR